MAAVFADFDLSAIKIGMLQNGAIIEVVAEMLRQGPKVPVVLDPVMISSSGRALLDPDAIRILKRELLPLVTLLTPNLPELAVLLDMPEPTHSKQIHDQGEAILGLGPEYVLAKGGHGEGEELTDLLFGGDEVRAFKAKRLESRNLHGTGCTLSAAIAAQLAKGHSMAEAVAEAHDYLQGAIAGARNAGGLERGRAPWIISTPSRKRSPGRRKMTERLTLTYQQARQLLMVPGRGWRTRCAVSWMRRVCWI